MHVACRTGFAEAVLALLEGGDNINRSTVDGDLESSYEGGLPLHIACGAGRRKVALTLIECGANPFSSCAHSYRQDTLDRAESVSDSAWKKVEDWKYWDCLQCRIYEHPE